jgi:hypothetical protein
MTPGLALSARVAGFTLPGVALGGALCAWRWGWQSGLALAAGALLGGLCLLGQVCLAGWAPQAGVRTGGRLRWLRVRLAIAILLKTVFILGFLGVAVCWLRLPPAELAGGYTFALVGLAVVGMASSRSLGERSDAR